MNKIAYLDGVPLEINDDETILRFAQRHQLETIPTLCDDTRLEPFGACRVCSVDVALTADGPKKVVASCHTPVQEGMHIDTVNERIQRLRKNIIELVITDHPLDCLTCEVSGNCQLQDVAASVGLREVRYAEGASHLDYEKDHSHPYMRTDMSKCINCSRCLRACDEIQGEFILGMAGRGFDSHIIKGLNDSFNGSDCVSCGACAQTCPTAAITDIYQSKAVSADKKVRTICSYCGVGCNLEVRVQADQILSIEAPEDAEVNAGHTCLKGRYAFKFYNHPDRLTSPLLKVDGKLVAISWDKALEVIAEKFTSIKQQFGADAIASISSSRCTNEENYLMQKFMRVVIGSNNIDCCARVCHSPTAYGMQQSFGTGAATNSVADIPKTDFIMIIGANPTAAHPVTGAKIKQKVMKGTPLIVIDPVVTELARYAQWHLQLRPGTNVALLNMMIRYIIEAGLEDDGFIGERCEDFELLKEGVMSLDLDQLEQLTGVDKQLVKEAALAYAKADKAMCFHGLGVTEHSAGSRTVMLIANLAMLTGNVGREGVGVNPLRGQNNVQGAADMGCQPHQGAGYLPLDNEQSFDYYDQAYGVHTPRVAGLKIPEMFNAAKDGTLKALWIMGEDVVQTDPNTQHVVESLSNLDFLLVQEIFLSETAKMADLVLPGTSFLEKSGTFTNAERRIQKVNVAVKPLAGTRTDGQIVIDVMNKMGYQQDDYTPDGMLEEISKVVPFFAGVKWSELGDQGKQWPVLDGGEDTQILHLSEFKRGKGKFHFHPFEESEELTTWANQYPLILTTGRDLEHYNCGTMTRRTPNQELYDEDTLWINRKDALSRGISDQQVVRLFSARGEIEMKAVISKKVKPGILRTTFHFPELMVNRITSDIVDTETLCPEYKVVSVDVARL
ncbi:MAG: formate dehydrogenase subunit alpha [Gammaproteobacteria bacterium]|nr:MAG: formate dehydrogenase subunit alpha [Gammaproteobacteria bacterium]